MEGEDNIQGYGPLDWVVGQMLVDPGISYWLKRAVREMAERDPVDAWKDASFLAELMNARLKAIQGAKKI